MNVVRWGGIPEITNIQIGKLYPRVEFQIFCQLIKYTSAITLILSDILTFYTNDRIIQAFIVG